MTQLMNVATNGQRTNIRKKETNIKTENNMSICNKAKKFLAEVRALV